MQVGNKEKGQVGVGVVLSVPRRGMKTRQRPRRVMKAARVPPRWRRCCCSVRGLRNKQARTRSVTRSLTHPNTAGRRERPSLIKMLWSCGGRGHAPCHAIA